MHYSDYTAGTLIYSHRGKLQFYAKFQIFGDSCTHTLDRSGSNLVHWSSHPWSSKVPNFTFIG